LTAFNINCFSIIEEQHLIKKIMAIAEYRSQVNRGYSNNFVRPLARVRGGQANTQYAEAFEAIRIRI
jgi:hypothetical protein